MIISKISKLYLMLSKKGFKDVTYSASFFLLLLNYFFGHYVGANLKGSNKWLSLSYLTTNQWFVLGAVY